LAGCEIALRRLSLEAKSSHRWDFPRFLGEMNRRTRGEPMRRDSDSDKLKPDRQEKGVLSGRSNHGTTPPITIPEGWLWVGQVGRPHGIRGAFFLKTEDNRVNWPGYKTLLLRNKQEKLVQVDKTYVSGGKLALQLLGLSSREEIEALYNSHLFVSRDEIKLEEQEYLVAELVGCDVFVEGRTGVFGSVVAVHDFGAQETLEIRRTTGEEDTVLYPFTEDFVIDVDEPNKKITVKDEPAFLDEQNK